MVRWALLACGIPTAVCLCAAPAPAKGRPTRPAGPRVVQFAGYDWAVKTSGRDLVGPGPNYFSDDEASVWVDDLGRLHLVARRAGRRWYAAEVVCQTSLGHGTYRFHVDGSLGELPPSVVLGMFTWSDDPAFAHREIDVEIGRWGDAGEPDDAQFVVQPWDLPGNQWRFALPTATGSTHAFEWRPTWVRFLSTVGAPTLLVDPADVIADWIHDGPDVPPAGGEHARINLWLFRGEPPADGRPVEVIIGGFEYEP